MKHDPIVEIITPLFSANCYHEKCCKVYRLVSGRLRCSRRPWWQCHSDKPRAQDYDPVKLNQFGWR